MTHDDATRERALAHTWELFLMLLRDGCVENALTMERTFGPLRDCVPIPRDDYEALLARVERLEKFHRWAVEHPFMQPYLAEARARMKETEGK